ncbi:hypothetical protein IFM89_035730 [Coptis chinensis]|uniref:F-box domain-containing protein n=1 Tax=Coptis chinensis TaxID=261450 RepID=A0A835GZL8_9MAGN|nr:hypothetical protein IFM89_035730 [Coptis chinensis]
MDRKQQKLLKQDDMSVAEDRISKLPNTYLHYLLSFLPTKDAVATSVLSTRWRFLWTSVPKLDFDYHGFYGSGCDDSCISTWISAIVKHKVQELDLNHSSFRGESIVLPLALFSCTSLQVLKLSSAGVVKVPSSISFPYLKILQLKYLEFFNECLTERFSSFPVLEDLSISKCKWINNSNRISISNTALKRLVMEITDSYKGGNIDFFKMNAPSLVSLSWVSDYLPIECNLSDMPSLASANVIFQKFRPERPIEEMGLVSSNILEALSHVKALQISGQGEKPYTKDEDGWNIETVPQCSLLNLKKVEYREFDGHSMELDVIKYLLEGLVI